MRDGDPIRLPRYEGQVEVQAVQIMRIGPEKLPNNRGVLLYPVDVVDPFGVSYEYLNTYDPQPGGYYILHSDGSESYASEKIFHGTWRPKVPG